MSIINVYSEIGKLKKVLVHTPGKEIANVDPSRLDELLFSAVIEPNDATKEHEAFCEVLKKLGVEVVQLVDLVEETYQQVGKDVQVSFLERWLDEALPVFKSEKHREATRAYLAALPTAKMIRKMITGIFKDEIKMDNPIELVVDPMPNLYFTRDPFASVGGGVTIHHMKYPVRRRETIFADFIFSNHKDFKDTTRYSSRHDVGTIEGGDVFIYTKDHLVIGVSERTKMEEILRIAKNLQNDKGTMFKTIYAINVPKRKNLMHLDTWITMVDKNKFIYSPNVLKELEMWEINLSDQQLNPVPVKEDLKTMLETIVGKDAILIPVAGSNNPHQIDIDVETNFDGTNYLAVAPGVVVGYSRNKLTNEALKAAGVEVHTFEGNQLSLGMGSARCMSMPLVRENIEE